MCVSKQRCCLFSPATGTTVPTTASTVATASRPRRRVWSRYTATEECFTVTNSQLLKLCIRLLNRWVICQLWFWLNSFLVLDADASRLMNTVFTFRNVHHWIHSFFSGSTYLERIFCSRSCHPWRWHWMQPRTHTAEKLAIFLPKDLKSL